MSLDRIVEAGSYVGNGTSQTITIGDKWEPALVIITTSRSGGPAGQRAASYKFAGVPGDDFLSCNALAEFKTANGITINVDGFSVGSLPEINRNNDTIYWTAIRAHPAIDVGGFTGDGNAGGQKVNLNRGPSAVLIAQNSGTERLYWKISPFVGDDTEVFQTNVTTGADIDLDNQGFIPKNNANLLNENYVYLAFYDQMGSTRHFRTDDYIGDGASPQSISLGAQPETVIGFSPNTSPQQYIGHKFNQMANTEYGQLETNYKWQNSGGFTLVADGFDAGADFNDVGLVYGYIAGMR